MAAAKVIWILHMYLAMTTCQILRQYSNRTLKNQGICKSAPDTLPPRMFYEHYKDCIAVLGSIKFAAMENAELKKYYAINLPNLREVSEFFVAYRANKLTDLGVVFPNLARIRGAKLLNNYGLIIHDMAKLDIIGLYGLLKIDRGGVMIWGTPNACYISTVDWETIAPRSRLAISPEEKQPSCNVTCRCTLDSYNHCWNNKKCQIYLEGPEADNCHEQCLGCRKTRSDECSLCRHFTHNGKCVSHCPPNTIILPDVQYCITQEECTSLHGWLWNDECVFHCPADHEEIKNSTGTTCKYYPNYNSTCKSLDVESLMTAQEAEKCVSINGYLKIHIKPVQDLMSELRKYLSRIQEVSDYVAIYATETITSLDFLSSLKRIRGNTLKNETYSLYIHGMASLRSLFTPNVTSNLKIDNGKLHMTDNPLLCMKEIENIKPRFPVQPNDTDIPLGVNGYRGECEDAVKLQVRIVNETSVLLLFATILDSDAHYTVLYARLPSGSKRKLVPESCSKSEWNAVQVEHIFGHDTYAVELTSLRPASTYAICIETFDPINRKLTRSAIVNVNTPVGKPEPPFIVELVSNSTSNSSTHVDVYWVDHKHYLSHISHYELDVSLLEIKKKDITVKNQCKYYQHTKIDKAEHMIVMKPPPEYECLNMRNKTATEEQFDVCSIIGCNNQEEEIPGNTTYGNHVRTLVLKLEKLKKYTRVVGLAPFRDYRFRLRACADKECSRSARSVVRTLPLKSADVPPAVHVITNEHGNLSVKWDHPELTNGPVLSFIIQVTSEPKEQIDFLWWCVLADESSLDITNLTGNMYSVRVCTRSMGSDEACSKWISIENHSANFLPMWAGVLFGVCLYLGSVTIASKSRKLSDDVHLLPIVDSNADLANESEPPSRMFSDFAPVYAIPLRDTQL